MANHLILGKKSVKINSKICSYKDSRLRFTTKNRNVEKRYSKITHIVLHWTGGEGNGKQVYKVLKRRNLAVEFFVDGNGLIYQYADPCLVACRAVGQRFWKRSISIEIQNYGYRKDSKQIPLSAIDRGEYFDKIHGISLKMARFYQPQKEAVKDLVFTLCKNLDIDYSFPINSNGILIKRRLKNQERDSFGVLGHFHLTQRKIDPGSDLFSYL